MRTKRHAALAAVAVLAAGCSHGHGIDTSQQSPAHASAGTTSAAQPATLKLVGESDVEVTLTGPIAVKYSSATQYQKKALGRPLTGDHNAGTRDSGLIFQQFQGGVITAKDDRVATPAYITLGRIREAWNVQRGPDGTPAITGSNGSAGPLGFPTSDQTAVGDLLVSNFEHGRIEYNPATGQVDVTVNGKIVPSGL